MRKVILFSALALSAVMLTGCAGKESTSLHESKVQSANTNSESKPTPTEYSEDLQKTDDWTFRYNKDLGGIIIERCLCAPRSTDDRIYDSEKEITVPDSFEGFEGLKVLEVGESAFSNVVCKSITLPDGLIYIDESAFKGAEIAEALTIPQTVKEIQKNAFKQIKCPTVELPPVEVISESLFEEADITSIEIPETVTEIRSSAFYRCGNLTGTLEIPSSVKDIQYKAFHSCYGITSVVFNKGLETIGAGAFEGVFANEYFLPDTIKEVNWDGDYTRNFYYIKGDGHSEIVTITYKGVQYKSGSGFAETDLEQAIKDANS